MVERLPDRKRRSCLQPRQPISKNRVFRTSCTRVAPAKRTRLPAKIRATRLHRRKNSFAFCFFFLVVSKTYFLFSHIFSLSDWPLSLSEPLNAACSSRRCCKNYFITVLHVCGDTRKSAANHVLFLSAAAKPLSDEMMGRSPGFVLTRFRSFDVSFIAYLCLY